jgi:glyceraldehyde-3-phosphate dehydrogenase/erythrose-4-phosphate dehydrogenase
MTQSNKPLRVAINGFGRIGRNVLRAWFENNCQPDIEIVAINDIAEPDILAHLLRFDSTHGRFNGTVILDDSTLMVSSQNHRPIHRFYHGQN